VFGKDDDILVLTLLLRGRSTRPMETVELDLSDAPYSNVVAFGRRME
jgi:hypothetical protein